MPPPPIPYRHATMPPSLPTQMVSSSQPMQPQTSAPSSSSADLFIDPTLTTRRHRSEAPTQYHNPADQSVAGLYTVAPFSPWNGSMGLPSPSANGMDASYMPYSADPSFAGPQLRASSVNMDQSSDDNRLMPVTDVSGYGPSPTAYAYPVSAPPITSWTGASQPVFSMPGVEMIGHDLRAPSTTSMGPISGGSSAHQA